MKKKDIGLIAGGALGGLYLAGKLRQERQLAANQRFEEELSGRFYGERQVYLIGGGIGMLAAAVYLIRDANFPGKNIHLIEGEPLVGGSHSATGSNETGFMVSGPQLLSEDAYENFWELFDSIPSLNWVNHSVAEEILAFAGSHPIHPQARLVVSNQQIIHSYHMGFESEERLAITRLLATSERKLHKLKISDWFGAHFFETNFWVMWSTTFLLQPWSSLLEFRRSLNRRLPLFASLDTLNGVIAAPLNQYESLVLPMKSYLEKHHVDFSLNDAVVDLDFEKSSALAVTGLTLSRGTVIQLQRGDTVLMTNGVAEGSSSGDWSSSPPTVSGEGPSAKLWRRISRKRQELGNPEPFFRNERETSWESFTVTCKGDRLLKRLAAFTGNNAGSGGILTLKESSWLLSIIAPVQPYFAQQASDVTVFWGYGMRVNVPGDFTQKTMKQSTGEEILYEWVAQMGWQADWEAIKEEIINVIPVYMPCAGAALQPRERSDRPAVIPEHSRNLALISQFVEQSKEVASTQEYSIRAARMAVYQLFEIEKEVAPVTLRSKEAQILAQAVHAMFR